MALELRDLLDPAAVARLGHLELIARTLVEGFLRGVHFSAAKGSSIEFAEHRPYVAGDEVRRIDWRTYGRTDRFYLKEYEDETNVRATLVLDVSASMDYASQGLSKFRYASCLAAGLGHLLLRQGDAVGLVLAGAEVQRSLPPKATPQHLRGIFTTIEEVRPSGPTGLAESLHGLAGRLRSRSFVLILSDLLEDPRAILRGMTHLRHRHSDVLLFQVLDPAEEEFPFTGWTVFRDMEEPSTRLRLDARQVRELYLDNLAQHREVLRKGCAAAGVDYFPMNTSTPLELSLATYLHSRKRRER